MTRFVLGALACLAAAVSGCGATAVVPCEGAEGCECYPNNSCNTGLSCRSKTCVNLGPSVSGSAGQSVGAAGSRNTEGAGAVNGAAGRVSSAAAGSSAMGAAGRTSTAATGGSSADTAGRVSSVVAGSSSSTDSATADAGSTAPLGECESGQMSTPGSAADPCKQQGTACSAAGGAGIASCGVDGQWQQCVCVMPQQDPTVPTQVKTNGGTCTVNSDCASNNCGKDRVGEMLCYGTAQPNDPCRDTFDCSSGACIEKIAGSGEQVCVSGINECITLGVDSCTENLAVANCQLSELCGTLQGDFNSCVEFGCMYWMQNPPSTGCASQLAFAQGGKSNCPK